MASIKDYFVGAGGKFLALVDTPEGSHQSEIGKASVFAGFLGDAPRRMKDGNPWVVACTFTVENRNIDK